MLKFIKAFFLLLIIVIIQISCESSSNFIQTNDTHTKSDRKEVEIKVLFDLPSIIGKNIDGVRMILGKPIDKDIEPSKLQMKMGIDDWDNNFEKDGYSLLVTYNPKNRKVIDFFIGTRDPSGATNDYSDLLQLCNIQDDSQKYSIIPVQANNDNTKYTGIRIKEK